MDIGNYILRRPLMCLVDEAGSIELASPEPFRLGFLLTTHPERLYYDINKLKVEIPPRSKSGEYHAREDHPDTRNMIRALLCLNNDLLMHIVEWDKADFSPDFFKNGRLNVMSDSNPLIASFAITASHIAGAALANGNPSIDFIVEGSKVDISSEHRSREQAFKQVLPIAIQKQLQIKRPSMRTSTIMRILTRRKQEFPVLSLVDHWLWAYCRYSDRGDKTVFPEELKRRTTIERMRECDIRCNKDLGLGKS
jgi:hypothetical protein